jgi:hypothetical protein
VNLTDSEIRQFDLEMPEILRPTGDQDVGGFDVAVNNASVVRGLQGVADFRDDFDSIIESRNGFFVQIGSPGYKVPVPRIVHHQKVGGSLEIDLFDPDDIRPFAQPVLNNL